MAIQKDQAVVIRLTEFSETSQIATLFAAENGLLRLIAKGARRSTKARFSAGLDLLELGELGFLPARGDAQLGTLTDWVQREIFAGVRRELLRLYGALYAAELVAQLTEEADPHPTLYTALVSTLRELAGDGPAALQITTFQRELLRAIGYMPNLEQCTGCGRRIRGGGPVFFSAGAGGLLCRDCEPHHVEKLRVQPQCLTSPPREEHARAWFDLLDYHLTYIAGRRFKTAAQLSGLLARSSQRRIE